MLSFGYVSRRVPDFKVLLCRSVHKSYYDALGLTPKASQGDIKNAYYKMSMVYHPDKGAGNSVKFQEISTAYEVLGNSKLRKLYDRGLLPAGSSNYNDIKDEQTSTNQASSGGPQNKSRSQDNFYDNVNSSHFGDNAQSTGPRTGKTDHYDFDAWTRAHYSETFEKQEYRKAEHERRKRKKVKDIQRLDRIATSVFFVSVFMVTYFVMTVRGNYDNVMITRVKEK